MQFRNDIQGLRAIAFLFVFIFHLDNNILPGGFLGVDVFFVISGFLVSSIILNDIDKKRFSFINFYQKRVIRIAPVYYLCLLAIVTAGFILYTYIDYIWSFAKSLKPALTFLSNRHFSTGESYFGPALSENPFLHTWSLAIEMQFYFVLPILLFLFRKFVKPAVILLLILTTAYSFKLVYLDKQINIAYFSLIARIPEFLIGVLYALYFKDGLSSNQRMNNVVAISSLLTLLVCLFTYQENMNYPGVLYLIPCIAAANLLATPKSVLTRFLESKPMVHLGALSYSLYLWHWPIMAFFRYTNSSYSFSLLQICCIVLLTYCLSWLSHTFIETQFAKMIKIRAAIYIFLIGSLTALAAVLSPRLIGYKKIPEYYTRPILGLKSHFDKEVETFGDTTQTPSFVLIGDSHALMLKPFLDETGKKFGFAFETLTCDGYPAIENIKYREETNSLKTYEFSKELIHPTYELIDQNDIVILAVNSFTKTNRYGEAVELLAQYLKSRNKKLILINSFPILENVNILRKNQGFIKNMDYIEKRPSDESYGIMSEIADKWDNVWIYDVSKSKILNTPPFYQDTLIYYNSGHINHHGSVLLSKDLGADFNQFLNSIAQRNTTSNNN